jgi:MFS family permease
VVSTPTSAVRPSSPERLLTLRFVLVVSVGLLYFLAIGALLPTVPLLVKHRLGGSETAVGIAVGAFAVGAVGVRPWAGRLGDRFGRRLLVIIGPTLVGLSVLTYHLVGDNLTALVVARLLGGLGEAAMFVGAGTMVTDLSPEHRRGEALSYWSVAIYGGMAFGPALGEIALGADQQSFGRVWTMCAVLCLAAAVLALGTRETLERGDGPPRGPSPLLHRGALLPGLVLFLVMIGLAGYLELLPLYGPEIGLGQSRGVFLLYGVTVLAVRILGARIPDRVGAKPAATAGILATVVGRLPIAGFARPAGLLAGTVIFALGMSLVFPALSTLALAGVEPSERGSVMGTVSTFFDAANGFGALLLGGVAHYAGYRGAFVGGAISSIAAVVLLRSRVPDRRVTDELDDDAVPIVVACADSGHV